MLNTASLKYLCPERHSFWRWDEATRVVVWTDGTTIAFRQEVEAVVEQLSGSGLPPFDALLLFLAACRESWATTATERGTLLGLATRLEPGDRPEDRSFRRFWEPVRARIAEQTDSSEEVSLGLVVRQVLKSLDRLNAMPPECRSGLENKAFLSELFFERVENRGDPGEARDVLDTLKRGFPLEAVAGNDRGGDETGGATLLASRIRFLTTLVSLMRGFRGLHESDLERELRRRTGLDQLPGAAELSLDTVADQVRALIGSLDSDADFAGLARLSRALMAAVHIPRTLSDWEDLPTGGLSDITNRGSPEHLLVTELAHDDLALAVRMVLNEALYFRREAPPRSPSGQREILIDCGIRLWGLPRVFTTAIAMALTATAPAGVDTRVYRARRDGIEEQLLSTREGLVKHLEALEPDPHPAPALDSFLETESGADGDAERILITHEDVLADPEFRSKLRAPRGRALYVATVSSSGRYRLMAFQGNGKKVLNEATLDLDALLAPAHPGDESLPLVGEELRESLPAILFQSPFPLLLPHVEESSRAASHPRHGSVVATRDGRWMHRSGEAACATQLTTQFPTGPLWWSSIDDEGMARALLGHPDDEEWPLLTAHLDHAKCSRLALAGPGAKPLHVFPVNETLVIVTRKDVSLHDLHGGEPLEKAPVPRGLRWWMGRFFIHERKCVALTVSGREIRWERLRFPAGLTGKPIAAFDRLGVDGPWVATSKGELRSLSGDGREHEVSSWTSVRPPYRLVELSENGHRLVLENRGTEERVLVELEACRAFTCHSGNPLLSTVMMSHGLRTRITRVVALGVDETGSLALELGTENLLVLRGNRFCVEEKLRLREGSRAEFSPHETPQAIGRFELRVARWKNGSSAWLDSRGLLHLVSHDRDLPHTSLVLVSSGETAGWNSAGQVTGRRCFLTPAVQSGYRASLDSIRLFTERLP